jgi:beta-xylosidase
MPLKSSTSLAQMKAIERVVAVSTRDGRRDAEADAKFRQAIGRTSLEWLDNLSKAQRRDVLFALLVAANAGDRRRIGQHADCDEEMMKRADAEAERRAAEAKAEKAKIAAAAAAEKAKKAASADTEAASETA